MEASWPQSVAQPIFMTACRPFYEMSQHRAMGVIPTTAWSPPQQGGFRKARSDRHDEGRRGLPQWRHTYQGSYYGSYYGGSAWSDLNQQFGPIEASQ